MLSRLDRWMRKTTFYCFLQNGLASRVASNGELPKWEFQGEAKLKFFLFNLEPIVKNQMFRTKSFLLKVFWGDSKGAMLARMGFRLTQGILGGE